MSAVAGAAEVHPETVVGTIEGRSPRQIFWARFRQDRAALIGGDRRRHTAAARDLRRRDLEHRSGTGRTRRIYDMTDDFGIPKGPNSSFWFGADGSGRDLFVRVLYGARTSLAGRRHRDDDLDDDRRDRRRDRRLLPRLASTRSSRAPRDVVLALPQLLLAIGIAAACGIAPQGCLNGIGRSPGSRSWSS